MLLRFRDTHGEKSRRVWGGVKVAAFLLPKHLGSSSPPVSPSCSSDARAAGARGVRPSVRLSSASLWERVGHARGWIPSSRWLWCVEAARCKKKRPPSLWRSTRRSPRAVWLDLFTARELHEVSIHPHTFLLKSVAFVHLHVFFQNLPRVLLSLKEQKQILESFLEVSVHSKSELIILNARNYEEWADNVVTFYSVQRERLPHLPAVSSLHTHWNSSNGFENFSLLHLLAFLLYLLYRSK